MERWRCRLPGAAAYVQKEPMTNPLNPLENAVIWILDRLHNDLFLSYGWSIVVLTLIVRAALVPLVIRQYRSMRQMQVLAPQIKEMQRKHKGDKRKQQEELMRLYQENNANPFASCLPLVAQIPVFVGLYYGLKRFSSTVGTSSDLSFLHIIPNITHHVSSLPLASAVILSLAYGGSQLLSTELSFEPHTPATQRRIMRLLPIPIVLFAFQFPFPAGVAIYWVTTNMWTAGQMLIIKHRIGLHLSDDVAALPARTSRTAPKAGQPLDDDRFDDALAIGEVEGSDADQSEVDAETDLETPAEAAPTKPKPRAQGSQNRRKPRPRSGSGGQSNQRRQPKKRR
jgi:YidC/Oxa1 family membrane protein insertase